MIQGENKNSRLNLFRTEVITARYSRLPGRLIVKTPRLFNQLVYVFLLSVVAAALIILLAEFSKKEIANGHLVPSLGLVKVIPGVNGSIEEINVAQGDHVLKGQVLARVASETAQFGGKLAIENQIKTEKQSAEEINQQIAQEQEAGSIRKTKLETKLAGLKNLVEAQLAEKQLRLLNIQTLRQGVVAGNKLAAKQILSQRDADKRENDLRDAELQLSLLSRDTLNLEVEQQQVTADLNALPRELNLAISRLKFQKLGIQEKVAVLNSQLHYDVVAPHDGVVDFVAQQAGQSITTSSPLLSIIPENALLQAEIFLPVKSITALKANQTIRIDYDAFPAARFGHAAGKVINVNQTVLDPSEAKVYGITTTTSVYRILASLDKQYFPVDGQKIALRAGVGFTTDIIVEKHPLWLWALKYVTEGWNAR
jgi:membrane fusion protein